MPSTRQRRPVDFSIPKRHVMRESRGFSLVELLVVMGITGLLLAMAAPSLLTVGPSRKASAMELSGVIERARAKALTTQENHYVAFSDGNYPTEAGRFRSYAIFGPDGKSDESIASRPLRRLTEWFQLPEGLVFGDASHFEISPGVPFRTLHDLAERRLFEVRSSHGAPVSVELPYLVFGASGQVLVPTLIDADGLYVGIVEGFASDSGKQVELTATRPGVTGSGTFGQGELIQISHYTGRTTLLTD